MKKETRIPQLDALKGVLCIIIAFFYHYNWLMNDGYGLSFPLDGYIPNLLSRYGYLCVEIYFALSGFCIALTYKKKIIQNKNNIILFIFNRIKKIFPIMTIALLATTMMQYIHKIIVGNFYYFSDITFLNFILSFFNISCGWFTPDNTLNIPAWFISVLMLCYVIYYIMCSISRIVNYRCLLLLLVLSLIYIYIYI